jgi:hypothetical protein
VSDSETIYFSSFLELFTENEEIAVEITLLNFSGEAVATPITGRFEEKETLSETTVAV